MPNIDLEQLSKWNEEQNEAYLAWRAERKSRNVWRLLETVIAWSILLLLVIVAYHA